MGEIKMSSTNCKNCQNHFVPFNLTYAVSRFGGRWKISILNKLEEGKLRFSEIRNAIPGITERMLTLQLKQLEKELLITRKVYAEVPVKAQYELTDIGLELAPIWRQLEKMGRKA